MLKFLFVSFYNKSMVILGMNHAKYTQNAY